MPDLSIEKQFAGKVSVGVDEAGRGPLMGRVYAAAVLLSGNESIIEGINDSKKLTAKKRESLFDKITKNYSYGIGYASVEEINELNILEATKLACQRALENIEAHFDIALIDGNMKFADDRYISIVGGDSKSLSIAAASIVAKVSRDQYVLTLAEKYPNYDWQNNKGYGTKKHLEAVKKYGVTEFHRNFKINLSKV